MIWLILSICLSVITVSYFKVFERFGVKTFQAVVINYVVCTVTGNLFSPAPVIARAFWEEPWFIYSICLGFIFILIFYSIALTSQKMGISVSMVAAKLSVVIPVSIACLFYHETMSSLQLAGIILSLVSVYFISKKEQHQQFAGNKPLWILPVIVFTGSGIIDAALKFLQVTFIPPASAGDILSTTFLAACVPGMLALFLRKERFEIKSIWWGIALGIPNFFCMYFLVKALESFNGSYVFPLNNISIVICSTVVSIFFFKEKLSRLNWFGFILAVISILIISFS